MNRYILDSDILTLFQFGHPAVTQHARSHPPAMLAVTVISVDEMLTGWYTKVRRAKTPPQIARAFGQLTDAVSFLAAVQIQTFGAVGPSESGGSNVSSPACITPKGKHTTSKAATR